MVTKMETRMKISMWNLNVNRYHGASIDGSASLLEKVQNLRMSSVKLICFRPL